MTSATFMSFTVQDMLDTAQIKANKFKQKISKFKLKTTIQKVIDM